MTDQQCIDFATEQNKRLRNIEVLLSKLIIIIGGTLAYNQTIPLLEEPIVTL